MVYPNRVQNPQEYNIRDGIVIPGIADFIQIHNEELLFRNIVEKTRFQEAKKRLYKSERHSIISYKKPYRF
jgi:hypothetical protein